MQIGSRKSSDKPTKRARASVGCSPTNPKIEGAEGKTGGVVNRQLFPEVLAVFPDRF